MLKDVTARMGSLRKEIKEVEEAFREEGVRLGERKKKLHKLEE